VKDLGQALRTETRTDADGNEYRATAAVTVTKAGGVQEWLWGDVDRKTTQDQFQIENFSQRRRGIANDCANLKKDVDHFNGSRPKQLWFPLVLEFTDDVAELEALRSKAERAA
jgi:hypothetical protein